MPADKQLHDVLDDLPDATWERFSQLARRGNTTVPELLRGLIEQAAEQVRTDEEASWLETVSRDERLVPVAAVDQQHDANPELANVKDELDQIRRLVQDYLTILEPAIQPIQSLPEHVNELSRLVRELRSAEAPARRSDGSGNSRPRLPEPDEMVRESWTAPFDDAAAASDRFRN